MRIEEIKKDFECCIDFGRIMCVIEFSDFGIEKTNDFILEKIKGYTNILIKGKIRDKTEFNKLINKMIKENFSISIYMDIKNKDMMKLKNVNNIIFNIYLNHEYKYSEEFINFYSLRNSRFIIKKRFINEFFPQYSIPKSKIFILHEEINRENLDYCYLNEFNYLYSFDLIKDILEEEDGED